MKVQNRIATALAILLICTFRVFAQQPVTPLVYRLSPVNKNWSMDISVAGFVVLNEEVQADTKVHVLSLIPQSTGQTKHGASNERDRLALLAGEILLPSVHLKIVVAPAQNSGTAEELRDSAFKELRKSEDVKAESVKSAKYHQIPIVSYVIVPMATPASGPQPRGLEAFLVRDGIWILIKMDGRPIRKAEEETFYSVLDSIKFSDTSSPTTSFDYYQKGKTFFLLKEYKSAIEQLSEALKLERRERRLEESQWRNLLEDLIDTYSATGNRSQAKALLDYAISNDRSYPFFQLGLARFYASTGDLDATIAALQKAFLNAFDNRPGRALPDPRQDRAFEKFWKVDRFRKAMKSLGK